MNRSGATPACHTGFISMPGESPVYDALHSFAELYRPFHSFVCITICVVGVLMNLMIIFVLTRKDMRTPINILLVFIAFCDSVVMLSYFIFILHFQIFATKRCRASDFTFPWAAYSLVHLHATIIGHTSSLWISVAMAQIRHSTLVWAEKGASRMITCAQAALVSAAIVALVCVAETPLFLTYTVSPRSLWNTPTACRLKHYANETLPTVFMIQPDASRSCLIVQLSFWTNGLVFKIIPCLLLTVFIGLLLRFLELIRRRRVQLRSGSIDSAQRPTRDRTTRMLITLLVIFLITEIPQGILAFLSGIFTEEFRRNIYVPIGNILDLLSLINSASNFVILCTMSKQFRQTFLKIFVSDKLYQMVGNGQDAAEMTVVKNRVGEHRLQAEKSQLL